MKNLGIKIPEKLVSSVSKLCSPAKFYLALSAISTIIYIFSMISTHNTLLDIEPTGGGIHHYTLTGLVIQIIFIILWVMILNYICQFKYGKKISWFIVLLPFFFMALALVGLFTAVSFIAFQDRKHKNLKKDLEEQKKVLMGENGIKKVGQQPPMEQIPSGNPSRPVIEGY